MKFVASSFLFFSVQFTMSLSSTLEKGAHHQALDLSEELPPHLHHHSHHQQHLHHSNSLASTTAVGGGRETPSRVVIPPPYSAAESGVVGSEAPLELRGSLDCWACSVLVTAQNLVIAAINACLAAVVFGTILTPAIVMVVFGFLCHSTVRTDDLCIHTENVRPCRFDMNTCRTDIAFSQHAATLYKMLHWESIFPTAADASFRYSWDNRVS